MKIEMRLLAAIKPYENNPRLNDAAVEAVAESIRRFGWRQPIVVDEAGVVIAGYTRLKAAQRLGLDKAPVHVAKDLSPEQVRAYRIADNKTAELAEWNLEMLTAELTGLADAGIDWGLLGFDSDDLAKLLDPGVQQGLCDPDDVPEPPDEAVMQRGDIWLLGEHRLMCGDSASAADVDRLLDGAPIHLVNADPPYNVKVEPRSNNAIAAGVTSFSRREDLQCERSTSERGKKDRAALAKRTHHQSFDVARQGEKKRTTTKRRAKDRPLVNDFVSDDEFDRLLAAWFGNMARVLLPGRGFYIWGGYANCGNYPPALKAAGLYFSQSIIWDKQHPVLSRKDFMGAHEWCFYGWREGAAHVYLGPNNATDLWHVKKIPPQQLEHLTGKPAELAVRALQYSSRAGENVLDLFGGSGSTLIAAGDAVAQREPAEIRREQAAAGLFSNRHRSIASGPSWTSDTSPAPTARHSMYGSDLAGQPDSFPSAVVRGVCAPRRYDLCIAVIAQRARRVSLRSSQGANLWRLGSSGWGGWVGIWLCASWRKAIASS